MNFFRVVGRFFLKRVVITFTQMHFKDNQLLDFLSEGYLRKKALFGLAKVSRLVNKAISGRAQNVKDNMLFTNILSTQIWVEKFISTLLD